MNFNIKLIKNIKGRKKNILIIYFRKFVNGKFRIQQTFEVYNFTGKKDKILGRNLIRGRIFWLGRYFL